MHQKSRVTTTSSVCVCVCVHTLLYTQYCILISTPPMQPSTDLTFHIPIPGERRHYPNPPASKYILTYQYKTKQPVVPRLLFYCPAFTCIIYSGDAQHTVFQVRPPIIVSCLIPYQHNLRGFASSW